MSDIQNLTRNENTHYLKDADPYDYEMLLCGSQLWNPELLILDVTYTIER